jgi:hypothetical protein
LRLTSFIVKIGPNKLSRELLKNQFQGSFIISLPNFDKNAIKVTFWGGFAVDADFSDRFSGSIEGPQNHKKPIFSIKFMNFPGGGRGPSTVLFVGPDFR